MAEEKENLKWILLIVGLVIGIVIGKFMLNTQDITCGECHTDQECDICEECLECEEPAEEKALISTIFAGWGENELNSKEIIFDFVVYNYGDVEAKNAIVTCSVNDLSGKRLYTKKKNIGNIASTSETYEEVIFPTGSFTIDPEDNLGGCYVSACDNCEILDLKIPEVRERFD